MKHIRTLVVAAVLSLGVFGLVSIGDTALALNPAGEALDGVNQSGGRGQSRGLTDFVEIVVNILFFVLGAIAVVMIIIGGIKFTVSNGDSSAITSAKNTILYAIVGLVVALLAYAIVRFVINQFK